jgi:hypothetical protein
MDEDESLRRYGLRPGGRELAAVRALLEVEAGKERRAQGDGDTELMKGLVWRGCSSAHDRSSFMSSHLSAVSAVTRPATAAFTLPVAQSQSLRRKSVNRPTQAATIKAVEATTPQVRPEPG